MSPLFLPYFSSGYKEVNASLPCDVGSIRNASLGATGCCKLTFIPCRGLLSSVFLYCMLFYWTQYLPKLTLFALLTLSSVPSIDDVSATGRSEVFCRARQKPLVPRVADTRKIDRRTDRQTDRQTVRQSDSQTDRQTDSQTVRQSDSQTVRQSDSQTVRQSDSQTVRQSDSQTVRQSNRQTVRQSDSRTVGQSDSQWDRRTDSQTDRQTKILWFELSWRYIWSCTCRKQETRNRLR